MVLILILGPAYVFSPIFTSIGDPNPISKTDLSMVLRVHYHKNETSSELSTNLFRSNSMYKDHNLDKD